MSTTTAPPLAVGIRPGDRHPPAPPLDNVLRMHCPACHRNTWLRDRPHGAGGVCWDCGSMFPLVKKCAWHDSSIHAAPDQAARHVLIDEHRGPFTLDACEALACDETWTHAEIDLIPPPWVVGPCPDCPSVYVATRTIAGTYAFWTPTRRWSKHLDDAQVFTRPENAHKAVAGAGGRAMRYDRAQEATR